MFKARLGDTIGIRYSDGSIQKFVVQAGKIDDFFIPAKCKKSGLISGIDPRSDNLVMISKAKS